MKKIIFGIIMTIVIILVSCYAIKNSDNNDGLKKVKVAEVTHTVFYAPSYVAMSEGYFKEEGLDIDLILTPGADKVMWILDFQGLKQQFMYIKKMKKIML